MFVDDNSDLFGQIRLFLEKAGDIRLDRAHSIKQAAEKIKGRTYDVIVSYERIPEVNGIEFMSDMDGIEFLQYLKSIGNSTPVILLCRRTNNKISVQEVTNATEIGLPPSGDIRQNLLEMVTVIKHTMLRRKAEREIKLQNEQLTDILSATPLGIFQVRNGIITWMNPLAVARAKVSLSSLVVSNANLHFIDRSLQPNVNITLEQLNGALSGLSSDDPQQGELHLQGAFDKTARGEVRGYISPWNPRQPLELTVSINEMDLLPADPYSGKYLGYRLTKGKLSAQLSYQLTDRQLKSENHFTVHQLTLGQKVESPDATRLPVRLAIAILKDRNGNIVLSIARAQEEKDWQQAESLLQSQAVYAGSVAGFG